MMPVIKLGLRICAHMCFFDLLLDRRVPGLSLCLGDAEATARRICAYLLLQPMTIQRSLVGSTPRKYVLRLDSRDLACRACQPRRQRIDDREEQCRR